MTREQSTDGGEQENVLLRYDGFVVTARDPVTGWEATAMSKANALAALAAEMISE